MTRRPGLEPLLPLFLAILGIPTVSAPLVMGAEVKTAVMQSPVTRPLQTGEWAEYLVAYPVDALESILRNGMTHNTDSTAESEPGVSVAAPRPIRETTWTTIPIRLEFQRGIEHGFVARMTYPGGTTEAEILLQPVPSVAPGASGPSSTGDATLDQFDGPPSVDDIASPIGDNGGKPGNRTTAKAVIRLDGRDVDVESETISEPGGTFVRWINPDLPFGLARLATPDVDVTLVGRGFGPPPSFPLGAAQISPPPGRLIPSE